MATAMAWFLDAPENKPPATPPPRSRTRPRLRLHCASSHRRRAGRRGEEEEAVERKEDDGTILFFCDRAPAANRNHAESEIVDTEVISAEETEPAAKPERPRFEELSEEPPYTPLPRESVETSPERRDAAGPGQSNLSAAARVLVLRYLISFHIGRRAV